MRRQTSQVSSHGPSSSQPSLPFDDETSVIVSEPLLIQEIAFGDPSQDAGDEVRFSVELTRLDGLNDTISLDIRRLKGNLRSYKFLYDTLRKFVGFYDISLVIFTDLFFFLAAVRILQPYDLETHQRLLLSSQCTSTIPQLSTSTPPPDFILLPFLTFSRVA